MYRQANRNQLLAFVGLPLVIAGLAISSLIGVKDQALLVIGLCLLLAWIAFAFVISLRSWKGFDQLAESHRLNLAVSLASFLKSHSGRRGGIPSSSFEALQQPVEFWIEKGMPELPSTTIDLLERVALMFPTGARYGKVPDEPALRLIYSLLLKYGRNKAAEAMAWRFKMISKRPLEIAF